MSEPTDYTPHLALSESLVGVRDAIQSARDAAHKLEKLARSEKRTETEDLEEAAAALARDLTAKARELEALQKKATEEFRRILAGEPPFHTTHAREPKPGLTVIDGGLQS